MLRPICLLSGAVLVSCNPSLQPFPSRCPPTAPAGALFIEPDSVEHLAGAYKLTLVNLSAGRPAFVSEGNLDLRLADTLYRYWERTLRGLVRRGDRPLVGTYALSDSTGKPVWHDIADVESAVLYLGCRLGCTDASPNELRLIAQTQGMIWGLWENQETGIGRLFNRSGEPAPHPAGYFCAERVVQSAPDD